MEESCPFDCEKYILYFIQGVLGPLSAIRCTILTSLQNHDA